MIFARALNLIDLFGRPVSISFFGKPKFNSGFGGICTLLFLGFLGWALYNSSKDFFNGVNPSIINSQTYLDNPTEMAISSATFPIAIGIQAPASMNYTPFIDESIYTVEFVHGAMNKTSYDNGTSSENVIVTTLAKEICQASYFGELANSFAALGLDTVYCLSDTQPLFDDLTIQGVYMSPYYEYIGVVVSPCNNDTSSITCKPPEVISEYLAGAFVNVLYVDTALNPNNFSRPDAKYRNVYSCMVSPANYMETTFDLSHTDVTTDSGWIIPNSEVKNFVQIDDIQANFAFYPNADGLLISITFQVSRLTNHCSRTYKKIQDVLAQVGGLANVGLMVVLFTITPFLNLKLRESLVNELFDIYPLPSKKKKPSKKQRVKQSINSTTLNLKVESDADKVKDLTRASLMEGHEPKFHMTPVNHSFKPLASKSPLLSPEFIPRMQQRLNAAYNAMKEDRRPSSLILPSSQRSFQESMLLEPKNISSIENSEIQKRPTKYASVTSLMTPIDRSLHDDRQAPQFVKGGYAHKVLEAKLEKLKKKKGTPKSLPPLNLQQKLNRLDQKIVTETEEVQNDPEYQNVIYEDALSNCNLASNSDHDKKIDLYSLHSNFEKEEEDLEKRDATSIEIKDNHKTKGSAFEVKTPAAKNGGAPQQKPQKINLTIWEYIMSFFYRSEVLKQKLDILQEGISNIDARLDVINILKKLREVDKLKAMLMEYDQLILFNNLPKPQIKPKALKVLRRSNNISYNHHTLIRKATFIEQDCTPDIILDAQSKLEAKKRKNEIDNKLISIYKGS